jgi:hypothetical protein
MRKVDVVVEGPPDGFEYVFCRMAGGNGKSKVET